MPMRRNVCTIAITVAAVLTSNAWPRSSRTTPPATGRRAWEAELRSARRLVLERLRQVRRLRHDSHVHRQHGLQLARDGAGVRHLPGDALDVLRRQEGALSRERDCRLTAAAPRTARRGGHECRARATRAWRARADRRARRRRSSSVGSSVLNSTVTSDDIQASLQADAWSASPKSRRWTAGRRAASSYSRRRPDCYACGTQRARPPGQARWLQLRRRPARGQDDNDQPGLRRRPGVTSSVTDARLIGLVSIEVAAVQVADDGRHTTHGPDAT